MILVVDTGMGNLGSVHNMISRIGADVIISSRESDVMIADKLILPGVGAFDEGMRRLEQSGLRPALEERVLSGGVPVLGVCLGMQLLTRGSAEGTLPGLGWLNATTVKFGAHVADAGLPIPHMGWSEVDVARPHPLLDGLGQAPRFYFVHSYHVICDDEENVLGTSTYAGDFVSVAGHRNVLGTQFHPEKSHKFGMSVLRNFVEKV